jgi:hypothetical protein
MSRTDTQLDGRKRAARYAVRVQGHLDQHWEDWFDGLTLTHEAGGTTLIEGSIPDQAALHGLLQRVRDLGLPLISVTPLSAG